MGVLQSKAICCMSLNLTVRRKGIDLAWLLGGLPLGLRRPTRIFFFMSWEVEGEGEEECDTQTTMNRWPLERIVLIEWIV